MDHVTKVRNAQRGLLQHTKDLNNYLSHPKLPNIERQALQQELSETSQLLDYTEQFVPRPPLAPRNPAQTKGVDL